MTDDDRPARNWGMYAFFGLMALFIALLMWARVEVGSAEPSEIPNITHTPQPTIFISYDDNTTSSILSQYELTNEVGYTTTPVPDFAATQRALVVTITAQAVEFERQMSEVTTTAEAREVEKRDELHGFAVSEAQVNLQSSVNTVSYEDELHRQTISHTVQMQAVELTEERRYQNVYNTIRLVSAASWRAFVLFVVVTLTLWFFWFLYLRTVEPEYEQEVIRLEVTTDKKRTQFAELPIDVERLHQWMASAVKGSSLSYGAWVENKKVFTRGEYDKLTSVMHAAGILEYVNNEPALGQRVTRAGRAAIRAELNHEGM